MFLASPTALSNSSDAFWKLGANWNYSGVKGRVVLHPRHSSRDAEHRARIGEGAEHAERSFILGEKRNLPFIDGCVSVIAVPADYIEAAAAVKRIGFQREVEGRWISTVGPTM
jgi:hypothetical protein